MVRMARLQSRLGAVYGRLLERCCLVLNSSQSFDEFTKSSFDRLTSPDRDAIFVELGLIDRRNDPYALSEQLWGDPGVGCCGDSVEFAVGLTSSPPFRTGRMSMTLRPGVEGIKKQEHSHRLAHGAAPVCLKPPVLALGRP